MHSSFSSLCQLAPLSKKKKRKELSIIAKLSILLKKNYFGVLHTNFRKLNEIIF